ncbi:MAG: hypothetical protein COC06_05200 [Bacteroidales bacterium]|nr:MAG: hypothetical protein COC06_05200 [Bacteroidales bacterium]
MSLRIYGSNETTIGIILFPLGKKQIKSDSIFTQRMILWGINLICFTQACCGLLQYVHWLPSNYSSFAIIGSFDKPAGFAAVLSISFSTFTSWQKLKNTYAGTNQEVVR